MGIIITIIARVFQLVMPSYVKNSIEVVEKYMGGLTTEPEARSLLLEYILIIIGAALLSGFFTFSNETNDHQCFTLYRIRPKK